MLIVCVLYIQMQLCLAMSLIKTQLHQDQLPREVLMSQALTLSLLAELQKVRETIPPTSAYKRRLDRLDKMEAAIINALRRDC